MAQKSFGKKFSIDDAFEEEGDESVCFYGSTSKTSKSYLAKSTGSNAKGNEVNVATTSSLSDNFDVTRTCNVDIGDKGGLHGLFPVSTELDNISRDNESLIPDNSSGYASESPESRWFYHPKVKDNWRVVLGAFSLFLLGIALLITGCVIEANGIEALSSFAFFLAGFICFIPGLYHVTYIMLAACNVPGFNFYSIPFFN